MGLGDVLKAKDLVDNRPVNARMRRRQRLAHENGSRCPFSNVAQYKLKLEDASLSNTEYAWLGIRWDPGQLSLPPT